MINLRQLARSDRAIGSITTEECHMIAAILDRAAKSWLFRFRLPRKYKDKTLEMRMLSAVLGRTPEEREPSMQEAIRMQMEQARKS